MTAALNVLLLLSRAAKAGLVNTAVLVAADVLLLVLSARFYGGNRISKIVKHDMRVQDWT